MMTFCNKTPHSCLGLPNAMENRTVNRPLLLHHHHKITTSAATDLEYSAIKSPTNASSDIKSIFSNSTKRDPGGIGFIDDVGGSVDGLMSCTESLGFESSDERRVDDQIESLDSIDELCSRKLATVSPKWKAKEYAKKEVKNFPPPLSSLSQNGKPTFFLQPVRKDGRLKLTEVKIGRPEVLRASRQDGRLRLHLIRDDEEDEDIQEQVDEEEEEEMQEIQESIKEITKEKIELEIIEEEAEEKVEERAEVWQLPVSGGGDSFRRCYELVNHHQHRHHGHQQHDLHVWRQHCVTIR